MLLYIYCHEKDIFIKNLLLCYINRHFGRYDIQQSDTMNIDSYHNEIEHNDTQHNRYIMFYRLLC
jgi:hypothetical protein